MPLDPLTRHQSDGAGGVISTPVHYVTSPEADIVRWGLGLPDDAHITFEGGHLEIAGHGRYTRAAALAVVSGCRDKAKREGLHEHAEAGAALIRWLLGQDGTRPDERPGDQEGATADPLGKALDELLVEWNREPRGWMRRSSFRCTPVREGDVVVAFEGDYNDLQWDLQHGAGHSTARLTIPNRVRRIDRWSASVVRRRAIGRVYRFEPVDARPAAQALEQRGAVDDGAGGGEITVELAVDLSVLVLLAECPATQSAELRRRLKLLDAVNGPLLLSQHPGDNAPSPLTDDHIDAIILHCADMPVQYTPFLDWAARHLVDADEGRAQPTDVICEGLPYILRHIPDRPGWRAVELERLVMHLRGLLDDLDEEVRALRKDEAEEDED